MLKIKQAFIKELLTKYTKEQISFGRFCELINEAALVNVLAEIKEEPNIEILKEKIKTEIGKINP